MAITKNVLEVEPRAHVGKGANRRLRASGRVPANVYGLDVTPYAVTVDPRPIEEMLHSATGRNTILRLSIEGGKSSRDVMLREIQREPVSGRIQHIDFLRVDPNKRMEVHIPVQLVGVAEGVKNEGGLLDFIHREVLAECLPTAIPEHLDGDVSPLHIGQQLTVADLSIPEGVKLLEDEDTVLAVVYAPKIEEEPTEEGEEEAAEAAPAEGEGGEASSTEEEGGDS